MAEFPKCETSYTPSDSRCVPGTRTHLKIIIDIFNISNISPIV